MPFFARQCGYWEAKITQCVDTYKNYWLKCQKERPFWRPVEEVLQWEFIDEPLPLPPPPTIEPTYFSDLDREIAAEAPAVITPTRETPARETPAADATDAPATEAPAADAPATDAPATEAPAADKDSGSKPPRKPPRKPQATSSEPQLAVRSMRPVGEKAWRHGDSSEEEGSVGEAAADTPAADAAVAPAAVEPSAVEPSAVEPPTGQPPSPAAAEPKDDMPLSPDYFGQVPLSQPLSQLTASELQAASAALMAIGF